MLSRFFRQLILLLPATAFLLIAAHSVHACSCGKRPTLLEAFEYADEVGVVRVVSIEKVENTPDQHYVDGVRSTTMVVEKVFKGNLKVSEQVVFAQGNGANCVWTFNKESVGQQYLLFLMRPERRANDSYPSWVDPTFWLAFSCGRSNGITAAASDLLYLENMRKVKGKTRISGSLDAGPDADLNLEGKTVKITGPKKVYKTKTNQNGVFELYDLPPGKYVLEPEIPKGWKIDPIYLRYSMDVDYEEYQRREREWKKRVEVTLEPKKHADVNFRLEPDNSVRGRVLGPKGTPMPRVCVQLWQPKDNARWPKSSCTDEEGRFEITSILKGDYVLVANPDGKPSTWEPFERIFYPNVADRDRAAVINISPGEIIEEMDIVIPRLAETITIEGVLRYSDGKPAPDYGIDFKVAKKDDRIDGDVYVKTDSQGRFTLRVLKGVKGELSSDAYLIARFYINCPKIEELILESGRDTLNVFTNKIDVTAEENLYNVELTFPFPLCEKKK